VDQKRLGLYVNIFKSLQEQDWVQTGLLFEEEAVTRLSYHLNSVQEQDWVVIANYAK
jgi:hypothetical protein